MPAWARNTEYTATECTINTAQVTVKYRGMKVLGDCRLFEGYFYWTLGASVGGAFRTIDARNSNNALLGDDVAGTYYTINKESTFSIPKTPGAEIEVKGDVWEKLSGTHLPNFAIKHKMESNNWSQGNHSVDLATVVGISSCRVRVDYTVTVR